MKRAAIICAVVMMVSLVPAFALNETSNNTAGTQVQNQIKTTKQTCLKDGTCDGNHYKHQYSQKVTSGTKCSTCDGDQHKYQYGKKNHSADANKNGKGTGNQQKHQYGKKNAKAGANCVGYPNCPKK